MLNFYPKRTFLIHVNYDKIYFVKMCLLFASWALHFKRYLNFLKTWSFLDRILLFVSSKIILHSCVNNHSMAKKVCWTFFHEIWAVDTEFLDIKMSHLRRGSSPVFNGFLLWLSDSQHLNPPWKIFILREKIRRHFIHFQLASGFYN